MKLIYLVLIILIFGCNRNIVLNSDVELLGEREFLIDASVHENDMDLNLICLGSDSSESDTILYIYKFIFSNNSKKDIVIEFPFNHNSRFINSPINMYLWSDADSIKFQFWKLNEINYLRPMYVLIHSKQLYSYDVRILRNKYFKMTTFNIEFYYHYNKSKIYRGTSSRLDKSRIFYHKEINLTNCKYP
jgi:hypothetical protein